ncbi:MAG: MoxR family ATPase [Microthrixaceae bacterium]|nr:MoxR family ATPase [Microthrixaceae bacterium]
MGTVQDLAEVLGAALRATLRGKPAEVDLALATLLSGGHLLIEDLPGTGKTLLSRALAAAVGGRFGRVQCTPTSCPPTSPEPRCSGPTPPTGSSTPDRCSPTCCSSTRSTGPHPVRSLRCWNRWRSIRSPSTPRRGRCP